MKKIFFYSKLLNIFIITVLLVTACPLFTISAKAYYDPYEEGFGIHNAIQYAITYSEQDISQNRISDENGGNCTYFIGKCLIAGGLETDDKWNDDDTERPILGYSNAFNRFTNVNQTRDYLFEAKSYPIQSFVYSFDGNLPYLPSAGDIIQIDKNLDGKCEHSAFCIGNQKDNDGNFTLTVAQNSPNIIVPFDELLSWYKGNDKIKIYYIRMTNTAGLIEVTDKYIGKTIAIKSLEVNQYVSSNTDQNVTTVDTCANQSNTSTWEYFEVKANEYGEIGFKSMSNGNYLSAKIDLNYSFAPIRAAYGQTYSQPQCWESFRIYEKDGIQYIQSQANGKWLQVVADNTDHPVKAASKMASTWERFQIEIVDYSPNNNAVWEVPSQNYSGDTSNYSSNSTIVSQYYWKTNYINGWYEGEWNNNHPNGFGKLTYDEANIYRYTLGDNRAIYYEGEFLDGLRYGYGTVVYENGYKDEGTFYGWWQDGKIVFEGKRWLINDTYNGYWPITITATSSTSADTVYGDWQSVE